MPEMIKGGESIKYESSTRIILKSTKTKKREERRKNFKESLSPKIAEFYFGYVAFVDKVKITKITNNDIQFKYKYLLPVGSTWEKPITQNLSELPDDIQKEIKQFLRIRKLKRLNKL